jgi:hypothetical protein
MAAGPHTFMTLDVRLHPYLSANNHRILEPYLRM